ncbi:MAG TPA: hypothetical protein VGE97_05095 [Nitrososphaera sp.]|jgi:hypothetical protein
MDVVNKNDFVQWIDRKTQMEDRHKQEEAELEAAMPVKISLTLLEEGEDPLEFNGLMVLPGNYYGVDQNNMPLAIVPSDIGDGELCHWMEFLTVAPQMSDA